MRAIKLLPTDLMAVTLPSDLKSYKLTDNGTILMWQLNDDSEYFIDMKNEYSEIGTCTKDHIDFDVEPYVESTIAEETLKLYKEYYIGLFTVLTNEESFRSLLSSNGLYFENPYGEKRPYKRASLKEPFEAITLLDNWTIAESNIVQKLLILKPLK